MYGNDYKYIVTIQVKADCALKIELYFRQQPSSVCVCVWCVLNLFTKYTYRKFAKQQRQHRRSTEKHAPKFRLPRILWTKFWIDNGEALVCGAFFPFFMPVRQTITMQSNGKYCNGKNVKCYFGFWYEMCDFFGAKIWMWQQQPKKSCVQFARVKKEKK